MTLFAKLTIAKQNYKIRPRKHWEDFWSKTCFIIWRSRIFIETTGWRHQHPLVGWCPLSIAGGSPGLDPCWLEMRNKSGGEREVQQQWGPGSHSSSKGIDTQIIPLSPGISAPCKHCLKICTQIACPTDTFFTFTTHLMKQAAFNILHYESSFNLR